MNWINILTLFGISTPLKAQEQDILIYSFKRETKSFEIQFDQHK